MIHQVFMDTNLMCWPVLQNTLHMPRSALELQVAAVLYAVKTFNFELGHVKHVL